MKAWSPWARLAAAVLLVSVLGWVFVAYRTPGMVLDFQAVLRACGF